MFPDCPTTWYFFGKYLLVVTPDQSVPQVNLIDGNWNPVRIFVLIFILLTAWGLRSPNLAKEHFRDIGSIKTESNSSSHLNADVLSEQTKMWFLQ